MPGRRVAFVVDRIGTVETQAVPLMSALARQAGHTVTLIDCQWGLRRAIRALHVFRPDILAYSVCSNQAHGYMAINRVLRQHVNAFVLFGGPHATFMPSLVQEPDIDAICRGEADTVFPQFLDCFGSDEMYEVDNFSFRMPDGKIRHNPLADLVADLSTLPFPDRELVYRDSFFLARSPVKGFVSGRGCPYECNYCFNHVFHHMYKRKGPSVRYKNVSYLIDEINEVKRTRPMGHIRFYDDMFAGNQEWLEEFADRFPREIGIPFTCNVHPNLCTDRYVRLLKRAGCSTAFPGVECGNERLRIEVLGRHVTNDEIRAGCENLRRHGIRILTLNIVGVPQETEEDIFETIRLNREIGADFADVTIYQPYPGTRAAEYCAQHGLIGAENNLFRSMYTESILNIPESLRQRIFVLHKLFALLVRYPCLEKVARYWPASTHLNGILDFLYRMYYGHGAHRWGYNSAIPRHIRMVGAYYLLLSNNRV